VARALARGPSPRAVSEPHRLLRPVQRRREVRRGARSYVEETKAGAGEKGDIEIPARIQLALRPYVGGPIYSIWANFRYRLTGGAVVLGFKLERPELILEAAFADIVTEIRDGRTDKKDGTETRIHDGIRGVPIFMGRPAA